MQTKLRFFFILFLLNSFVFFSQTQKAKYTITFTSVWNSTDHGTLPSSAHWSRLVGATHKTKDAFLAMGQKATTGIKNVAEVGNNTVFNSEVNTAISNGEANQYINGNGLGSATGTITISDLEVDKDYPLLTLVSMIAPSPDWMIAVNGVELLDGSDNWKTSISIDLFPYDAGTDSGTTYTAANSVTNPAQNISSLKNISPFNDQKIGTLTINLTETLSTDDVILKNNLKLFYNNSTGNVQFNNADNIKITKIEIYSVLGKRIANHANPKEIISFNNYPNGLYILKLTTNKGNLSRKILKR